MPGVITLDERDREIVRQRVTHLDSNEGPRVGDFVRFADGTERRISYLWPDGAQTSEAGSYYLGDGYVSMSGSLHPCVPLESLTPTDEQMDGWVWIFHHDHHTAHNGVDVDVPFRVYTCDREPPR